MRRIAIGLLLLLTAGLSSSCSSSDAGDIGRLIVATWRLFQLSTDGGLTFDPVDPDTAYRVTFNSDDTWSDSDGHGGVYELRGGRLSAFSQGNDPDAFATVSFFAADSRMQLEYFTDETFRTTTDRVSRYQKIN